MSKDRSRFDENGELNIPVTYDPNESIGDGEGHQGNGGIKVTGPACKGNT